MSYTREIIGLEQFANCCDFHLSPSHVLTARCHLRDATGKVLRFERTVDLKPAIDLVARNLAAYHARLHGQDQMVAGWMDIVKTAVSTVKKVAQNKTVKSLYAQAKPFIKDGIKELPGGKTALDIATKAAKVYDEAKKGSQKAMAVVKQVKAMADSGHAEAQYAVKVMQNVGELTRQRLLGNKAPVLPEVAQQLNARGHAQGLSYYHLGVTSVSGEGVENDEFSPTEFNDIWNPHYDIVGSFWSKAKWAVPGYAAYRGAKAVAHAVHPGHKGRPHQVMDHRAAPASQKQLNKQWGGRKAQMAQAAAQMTPDHVSDHPADAGFPPVPPGLAEGALPAPDSAPQSTTPDLPTPESDYDPGYDDQAEDSYYDGGSDDGPYADQDVDQEDAEVSGWLYNRRYRTVPEQLIQSQRSPGVAMAARELYNRGLGRQPTSLVELAKTALNSL